MPDLDSGIRLAGGPRPCRARGPAALAIETGLLETVFTATLDEARAREVARRLRPT